MIEENITRFDIAVNDRWIARVKVLNSFSNIKDNREARIPEHKIRRLTAEESFVEVTVVHEFVNEEKTAAFRIGGEADGGNDEFGAEFRGKEEFVMEFALALVSKGGGVHEFNSNRFSSGREGTGEDRTEASMAEESGEGVGGSAEEVVGERVRRIRIRIGGWSSSFSFT